MVVIMKDLSKQVKEYFCYKYGLDIYKLSLVKNPKLYSDGFVYFIDNLVLKIMKIQDYRVNYINLIEKRIKYVLYLNEFMENVIKIKKNKDNEYICSLFYEDKYYVAFLMYRIHGIHLELESLNSNIIKTWGKETAIMNKVSINFDLNLKEVLCKEKKSYNWLNEWEMFNEICNDNDVSVEWNRVREKLISLNQNYSNFGYTHNDNSLKNVLNYCGSLNFIDFDVSNYNWFINDLAIPIFSLMERIGGVYSEVRDINLLQNFIHDFIEGYLTVLNIDNKDLKSIDIFLDYRRILYYIVMNRGANNHELENLRNFITQWDLNQKIRISKLMNL